MSTVSPFPNRPLRALLLIVGMILLGRSVPVLLAQPQNDASARLFASDEPLDLTLTGDLRAVFKDTRDDRPYRPAQLWHLDANGDSTLFEIGLKTRGFYRRKYLNCNVPPLRLNFKKQALANTVFAGQDKLKLVTHCQHKNKAYQQFALQEYLIYKIYNLLTEYSFRVRLVRITYADINPKREPITRYGFLIEDEDLLAERFGGQDVKRGVIHQEATNKERATLMAVFQYMVANTDWSVPGHHNIKIVYLGSGIPPVSIPYDFDMAGLINAPYAQPDKRLQIRSVRERLYRGYCRTPEEFGAIFDQYNAQKDAIYALFQDDPYLAQRYKDRSVDFLEAFYTTISKPRLIKKEFLNMCLMG